jgi:protein-tyrosine phosphatase
MITQLPSSHQFKMQLLLVPPRHARKSWYNRTLARVGAYASYGRRDVGHVRRLVFVCAGNICRSPFAEFVAAREGASAISFGLQTVHGVAANVSAVEAAHRMGYALDTHRARAWSEYQEQAGDLLVLMEPAHIRKALSPKRRSEGNPTLLGMWAEPRQPYIFDPYGMPPLEFDRCFELIRTATINLVSAVAP